ncbi:NAD(P)/FAD-dependent oxidoreductase [Haladaptatus pallidirubidus]|uniref:NAD(P)/FAD-dependent oxidoreductase n=1 Tax=Haladaptatus pallidirubidus TaxID=1008152 RepID=A0AAV3UN64_9EURY|nr:FAD-dependent oxidoreductase [Haladaptatus pallidirubidus]
MVGKEQGEKPTTSRDVVVVGGGASGLSAAVFLARYGLDTLVIDGGSAAIRQCVHLENYLGFPGGIPPETFLALSKEQAEFAGAEITDGLVVAAEKTDDGFRVATKDGREVEANRLIAASVYDDEYLSSFEAELENVEPDGKTAISGLYVTGWLGEAEHQAIVSAGNGARTALALVRDVRKEDEGLWEDVADHYYDWTVEEGRYSGTNWEWLDEFVAENVPEDATLEDEKRTKERLKREYVALELDDAERAKRAERGRVLVRKHVEEIEP